MHWAPSWTLPALMERHPHFSLMDEWSSPHLSSQPAVWPAQWKLIWGPSNGQLLISGVSQRVNIKHRVSSVPAAVLHPWQADPPLPSLVEIDLSNHYTRSLLSPNRWHISQRNARVLISDPRNRVVGLDAAHYKMLCALCNQSETPTERFLSAVQSSCFAQQTADLSHHVPWSSHLLSCLRRILGADLLIGAQAVVFNPHFQLFFSPEANDLELGGVKFGQQYLPVLSYY